MLDERGIGHGAEVFSVFAATVVLTRIVGGGLPDRIGAARCAFGAALVEAVGLLLLGLAQSLPVAILGAMGMGAAFSLLFPALSLLAVNRVEPERRGAAMGTFTASFDLGMLVGSAAVGAAAAVGGYSAAFFVASAAALTCAALTFRFVANPRPSPPEPAQWRVASKHGQPPRVRDQPLSPAAQGQPGRLAAVGPRRPERGRKSPTSRSCSRSATPPATGAT